MKTYASEEYPQNSPEWLEIRSKCLVTASDAGPYLFKKDKTSANARQKRILNFLCSDCYRYGDAFLLSIKDKEQRNMAFNLAIQRGNHYEQEALGSLSSIIGQEINPVGIITTDDGLFGASPDGLIGNDAGCEVKVPLPETHLSYILEHMETGEMINEYLYQVHFNLAISGRDVWHFYSHSVRRNDEAPDWVEHPPLHIQAHRNNITESILEGMEIMRNKYYDICKKLNPKKS
jgi:YqaJ-like viral recombinase domain